MILRTFSHNGKWFAEIYDGGNKILRSGPEYRVGCAIRSVLNALERGYGKPSSKEFTIDLSGW